MTRGALADELPRSASTAFCTKIEKKMIEPPMDDKQTVYSFEFTGAGGGIRGEVFSTG
jgi:hypothetical protein